MGQFKCAVVDLMRFFPPSIELWRLAQALPIIPILHLFFNYYFYVNHRAKLYENGKTEIVVEVEVW